MEVPQKIKSRTIMSLSNSTSSYLSEENKNSIMIRYLHHHDHCSLVYNTKT